VAGCGGSNVAGKATVSGKVLIGGKPPLTGSTITFIGPDGKENANSVDADGSYIIQDAPVGECKVVVKGGTGPTVSVGGTDMPGMPKSSGVKVPPKYEKPGALSFNVQKGKNTKDFDLTP